MSVLTMDRYYFDGSKFKLHTNTYVWTRVVLTLMMLIMMLLSTSSSVPTQVVNGVVVASSDIVKTIPLTESEVRFIKYYNWVDKKTIMPSKDIGVFVTSLLKYSDLYGHSANLLLALVKVESGFNQYAVSNSGAVGLTQVMLQYHKEKMKKTLSKHITFNPFDIDTNLMMGAKILKEYGGNLQRYNGGTKDTGYPNDILIAKSAIDKQINSF